MIQQQEGHSRAFSGHCECSLHYMNARFWSSSILRILSLQKIWNSPSKYPSFKFNKQNEKVSVGVVTLLSILGSLAPSSRITAGKVCRVCNTKMIFCVKEVWLVFAGSVTFPSTTLTRSRSSFCSAAGPIRLWDKSNEGAAKFRGNFHNIRFHIGLQKSLNEYLSVQVFNVYNQ